MSNRSPYEVECPTCTSPHGRECVTRTGYGAAPHLPRWQKVGITRPNADDRERAYEHIHRIARQQIEERYQTPAWLTEIQALRVS